MLSALVSVWEFSEQVQQIIHEYKYFRKKSLAKRLAAELAVQVQSHAEYRKADVIIPVPLHRTKFRERGYNQSLLLSLELSHLIETPVEAHILKRTRHTQSQSKLNAVQREQNVRGAFKVLDTESLESQQIILVDDVMTTGATLTAAGEPLLAAGAERVLALTLARAM